MVKTTIRGMFAILVLVGASFGVSVSVSSPTNGATVSSPVAFRASASSSNVITGWRIYVDNTSVYLAGTTSSISPAVAMSTGTHNVIVRAWDSTGAYGSVYLTLNVSTGGGTPAPSPTPTPPPAPVSGGGPTPPSNATVFSHIENMTSWGKCSSPSCSGGVGSVWSYYVAPNQTSPSLDGSSAMFYISGPAYTDDLFWMKLGNNPNFTHFISDFWVMTDSSAPAHAEALEFDTILVSGGRKYNWSTECNYWTRTWDTWNEATQHWVHSNAVCQPFSPNVWHHVKWAIERVGTQTHYLSVTVDGVTQNISSSYAWQPAPATNWTNGAIIAQVQQDINSSSGSYKEWIDQFNIYAW
jgi:hypothetical protein